MRYEKGHKDTTRKHIIDVAARRFRNDGVAAAGLAGIMTDAGLTNGAFYTHFSSKDDLVCETITTALDKVRQRILAADGEGAIRDYLSARHRDHPETGCPTSALVAEIARLPRKTRAVYTERVAKLFDLIAGRFAEGSEQERRRRAMALYGLMIGTLQLARAVSDKKLSDEILENGLQTALALSGRPTGSAPSEP